MLPRSTEIQPYVVSIRPSLPFFVFAIDVGRLVKCPQMYIITSYLDSVHTSHTYTRQMDSLRNKDLSDIIMPTNGLHDVVTLSDPNIITTQQDIVVPKQITRCGFKCHLDKASNKMMTHYDKKSLYPTVYTMWVPYVVLFRQPKNIR